MTRNGAGRTGVLRVGARIGRKPAIGLALIGLFGSLSIQFARAQEPELRFAGFTVYGTDQFDPDALGEEFASVAEALMSHFLTSEFADIEQGAEPIICPMRATLSSRGNFASVEIETIVGGETDVLTMVIEVDVVEEADRSRRMPFRDPPTGSYGDPAGVFSAWVRYEEAAFEMMRSGQLFDYDLNDCPVLHCIFGFEPPTLAPFLEIFNSAAREHEELLYEIVANDQDNEHRSRALLTLAHTNDVDRLLPVLSRAIYDSEGGVRNDAMRIMLYIAERDPELSFPVSDLIQAMDFPNPAERNKAAYALSHLSASPRHAPLIREEGLPNVLKLLRTSWGPTHEPAYETLKILSGENYASHDYSAWEAWAAKQTGETTNP